METKKSGYSSRFALICVLIGGSVGTGNLWRFPRLVANTGGAAFIIVITVCVFLTALPLLYVENFMGRATRHSAPGAFHDICGKKYTCLGMFATLAYLLMLAYYLVVLAWCLRYAGMSLTGGYFGVDKESLFTTVTTANPATIAVWAVALILVYFGIAKQEALEKVSSILMPCLFGLLIGLVVYALTRKGAYEGLKYTFTLDPKSLVDINIWKEALTQVAWSIGPGTMMMITAAMVSHKDGDITLNSHVQAFGDMTVAMLGTVCVLPIIFANALTPEAAKEICASGNNGLTFMALTEMFESMAGGRFVGCAFFLCLSFAAFTSATLMAMCGVNILIDCGMSRKKGSLIVVLFLAIVGLPSAINPDILNNQDNVWGFGLMWGSLFLGIAAMKFGAKKMRTKFLNPVSDIKISKTFDILAPYVAPLLVLAVLVVWMVSSIGWSDTPWAMTFTGVTTGTILYQWIVVFIASIFLSRWYNKKIVANYYDGEEFPEMPEGLL